MTDYTPEMHEADVRIAVAMGWIFERNTGKFEYITPGWYFAPGGTIGKADPPRFHESHEARASLLKWLARSRQYRAKELFMQRFGIDLNRPNCDGHTTDLIWSLLTASPAVIAEAVDTALQEVKKEGVTR
jgi:hypothetical protein